MPTPAHALTPAALEAVESMRRYGHERQRERAVALLVTKHGHKRAIPYDGPLVPAAARTTERKAKAAGFETTMHETAAGCSLHGVHRKRGVGFAAHWHRGKTSGGTWHERRETWKLVDISSRPIGVDQRAKTTKVGCRHDANDKTRLVLTASPRGIPLGITEIERRIACGASCPTSHSATRGAAKSRASTSSTSRTTAAT